jgi:hypothetical protein
MAKSKKEPKPEQLIGLRRQIQEWRQNRTVPGAMPGVLWDQAIALAKEFGVCRIARAVGLDYTALRKRTEQAPATGLVKPTFVQLPATIAPAEMPVAPTTIEITARDGARMRIHLEAGHGTEAASIVAAFLGSRV